MPECGATIIDPRSTNVFCKFPGQRRYNNRCHRHKNFDAKPNMDKDVVIDHGRSTNSRTRLCKGCSSNQKNETVVDIVPGSISGGTDNKDTLPYAMQIIDSFMKCAVEQKRDIQCCYNALKNTGWDLSKLEDVYQTSCDMGVTTLQTGPPEAPPLSAVIVDKNKEVYGIVERGGIVAATPGTKVSKMTSAVIEGHSSLLKDIRNFGKKLNKTDTKKRVDFVQKQVDVHATVDEQSGTVVVARVGNQTTQLEDLLHVRLQKFRKDVEAEEEEDQWSSDDEFN